MKNLIFIPVPAMSIADAWLFLVAEQSRPSVAVHIRNESDKAGGLENFGAKMAPPPPEPVAESPKQRKSPLQGLGCWTGTNHFD